MTLYRKGQLFFGVLIVVGPLVTSCDSKEKQLSSLNPVNWSSRGADITAKDSLVYGQSYLSVYSEIYSQTEHRTHNLTATVSLRNVNVKDSIYIVKSEYYNTNGGLIRTYFDKPIFIAPLETVEIVIDESDEEGGSGANFLFEWAVLPNVHEPLFEAVMISTSGQQGLSFTTRGIRTK